MPLVPIFKALSCSNALGCALHILMRMKQIMKLLPEIQDDNVPFFRILLDLFVQIETKELEIDLNPLIHFLKIDPNEDIDFISLFSAILSDLCNSQNVAQLITITATQQSTRSSENLCILQFVVFSLHKSVSHHISKQYSSIIPSEYLFIQPQRSSKFDISLTLDIRNKRYQLCSIVVEKSHCHYIVLMKEGDIWISIDTDSIKEVVETELVYLRSSKIVLLVYCKNIENICIYYNFHMSTDYCLRIYEFSASLMKYIFESKKKNLTRRELIKEVLKFKTNFEDTEIFYSIKGEDKFRESFPEKFEGKSINVCYEKKGNKNTQFLSPFYVKSYSDSIIPVSIQCLKNKSVSIEAQFHADQTSCDVYSFTRIFLKNAEVKFDEKLKLFLKKGDYLIVPENKKNITIREIVKYFDSIAFYVSTNKREYPQRLHKFDFSVLTQKYFERDTHRIVLKFGMTGKDLIRIALEEISSPSSDSQTDKNNRFLEKDPEWILFKNDSFKIERYDIDDNILDYPDGIILQIKPPEEFTFFILGICDKKSTIRTKELAFAFHINATKPKQNLINQIAKYIGSESGKFDLYKHNRRGGIIEFNHVEEISQRNVLVIFKQNNFLEL